MERTSFEGWNCSVARTLEVVGDWWTMMLVREAFYGTRTFSGFEKNLEISRNSLTRRLGKMEADEIIERRTSPDDARSKEYRLTDKGRDLFVLIVAMTQWGDRWQTDDQGPPVVLKSRATGQEIETLQVISADGKPVGPRDIYPSPGPGADEVTRHRFGDEAGSWRAEE